MYCQCLLIYCRVSVSNSFGFQTHTCHECTVLNSFSGIAHCCIVHLAGVDIQIIWKWHNVRTENTQNMSVSENLSKTLVSGHAANVLKFWLWADFCKIFTENDTLFSFCMIHFAILYFSYEWMTRNSAFSLYSDPVANSHQIFPIIIWNSNEAFNNLVHKAHIGEINSCQTFTIWT